MPHCRSSVDGVYKSRVNQKSCASHRTLKWECGRFQNLEVTTRSVSFPGEAELEGRFQKGGEIQFNELIAPAFQKRVLGVSTMDEEFQ